jgi:membrane-associated phospholipid phosphatase
MSGFTRNYRISIQGVHFLALEKFGMFANSSPFQSHRPVDGKNGLAMLWLLALGTAYLSTYWLSNRLTQARTDIFAGVFGWERAIPFVEWTIIPYLSIALFFMASFFMGQQQADYRARLLAYATRLLAVLAVSLVCFALIPMRYTFIRPETSGLTGLLFDALNAFDMPYNRAPSLHISVLVILWMRFQSCLRGRARVALACWFTLIGMSVLTTYQHHVIDVVAGYVVGWLGTKLPCRWVNFRWQ